MVSKKSLLAILLLAVGALVFLLVPDRAEENSCQYYHNQGYIFGTYYNIRYAHTQDVHEDIQQRLQAFDRSLSTFNPHSTISVINQGRDTVWDEDFTTMYHTAEEITALSHGAFDITVAPLVNAWGFGFKHKETITPEKIDSLRRIKNILDASAIAKGQSCDVIAQLLADKGIHDYLVDIGGEVVAHGHNDCGEPWRIGINKPIDDNTGTRSELEAIITTDNIAMATSGNYRNFYYDGEQKRSHTIDPRTGYPVQHSLLSATIVSSSCMRADALATACMVLGADSALLLIESLPDTECFLIVGTADSTSIIRSKGWNFDEK